MKALSVKQPWATMLAAGFKIIETRTWPTNYRGEFLIVSSASPRINGLLSGYAVAVARITDCRPMTEKDEDAACCKVYPGAWAWKVEGARLIEPFPVKGSLKLFDVSLPESYREYGPFEGMGLVPYLGKIIMEYGERKGRG